MIKGELTHVGNDGPLIHEVDKSESFKDGPWLTFRSTVFAFSQFVFIVVIENEKRTWEGLFVFSTHRWRSVRNWEASWSTAVSQMLPGAEKLAAARPSVRDPLRGCWGPRGWRLYRSARKSVDSALPRRPPPRHTILRRYCSLLWPCTTQHDIRVKH